MHELRGWRGRGRIGIVMDECHMGLPVCGGVGDEMGEYGRGGGKAGWQGRGIVAVGIEMSVGVRGESVGAGMVGGEGEGRVGDCEGGHVKGESRLRASLLSNPTWKTFPSSRSPHYVNTGYPRSSLMANDNISRLTQSHSAIAAKKRAKHAQIKEIVFDDEARTYVLSSTWCTDQPSADPS